MVRGYFEINVETRTARAELVKIAIFGSDDRFPKRLTLPMKMVLQTTQVQL